jgi:hypothetical protein
VLILLDFKSLGICTSVSAETTGVNDEEKPVPQGFASVSLSGHTPRHFAKSAQTPRNVLFAEMANFKSVESTEKAWVAGGRN